MCCHFRLFFCWIVATSPTTDEPEGQVPVPAATAEEIVSEMPAADDAKVEDNEDEEEEDDDDVKDTWDQTSEDEEEEEEQENEGDVSFIRLIGVMKCHILIQIEIFVSC